MTNEEIQDMKKKIEHLEYDMINPLKEQVNDIKITLSNNDILTKQSIESTKKLSDTIDILKTTMIEMGQNIKETNNINAQLAKSIEKLNTKITSIEEDVSTKIKDIDDKTKIDVGLWIKQNWFKLMIIIVFVSYIIFKSFGIKIF